MARQRETICSLIFSAKRCATNKRQRERDSKISFRFLASIYPRRSSNRFFSRRRKNSLYLHSIAFSLLYALVVMQFIKLFRFAENNRLYRKGFQTFCPFTFALCVCFSVCVCVFAAVLHSSSKKLTVYDFAETKKIQRQQQRKTQTFMQTHTHTFKQKLK